MSFWKLFDKDADLPVYKFKPKPDITFDELVIVVSAMLTEPIRVKENETFRKIKRHFERLEE